VGDETLASPTLRDKTLHVPVKEEWQNMGIKLWWGLRCVLDTIPDCEGVFKLDDDVQVLDAARALEDMKQLARAPYSGLGVGIVHAHQHITYAQPRVPASSPWHTLPVMFDKSFAYAGGSFFFLSSENVNRLYSLQTLVRFSKIPLEDVLIGEMMAEHRVPLTVVSSPAFRWGHLDQTLGCSLLQPQ
jgi:hypothetical protein